MMRRIRTPSSHQSVDCVRPRVPPNVLIILIDDAGGLTDISDSVLEDVAVVVNSCRERRLPRPNFAVATLSAVVPEP
jgi:hypothetical protein